MGSRSPLRRRRKGRDDAARAPVRVAGGIAATVVVVSCRSCRRLPATQSEKKTAKINQGNIALKRVVESIANGDSHVPFRDSKLTMLLQDSFEDDKSKILMILCASPDPKEMHKTISTLEYGAKAKCIVRAAHMPTPTEKINRDESSRSRIVALNQFISKLEMDSKLKEKERDETYKSLLRKEEEVVELSSKIILMEGRGSFANEEDINKKIEERTHVLRLQLMAMEQKMLQQQEEILTVMKRLEEMESEKNNGVDDDRGGVMKDHQAIYDVKEIHEVCPHHEVIVKTLCC